MPFGYIWLQASQPFSGLPLAFGSIPQQSEPSAAVPPVLQPQSFTGLSSMVMLQLLHMSPPPVKVLAAAHPS
jgi:hypothetical protein